MSDPKKPDLISTVEMELKDNVPVAPEPDLHKLDDLLDLLEESSHTDGGKISEEDAEELSTLRMSAEQMKQIMEQGAKDSRVGSSTIRMKKSTETVKLNEPPVARAVRPEPEPEPVAPQPTPVTRPAAKAPEPKPEPVAPKPVPAAKAPAKPAAKAPEPKPAPVTPKQEPAKPAAQPAPPEPDLTDWDIPEPLPTSTTYEETAPAPAVKARRSIFPALLALLAVSASGYAGWMVFDLQLRVQQLSSEISSLQLITQKSKTFDASAMQQQLTAMQQRLDALPIPPAPKKTAPAPVQETTAPEAVTPTPVTPATKPKPMKAPDTPTETATKSPQATTGTPAPAMENTESAGDWLVNLSSFADNESAEKEAARLQKLQIKAEVSKVIVHGKAWYRVVVTGFPTAAAAKDYSRDLEEKYKLERSWVGRRQ